MSTQSADRAERWEMTIELKLKPSEFPIVRTCYGNAKATWQVRQPLRGPAQYAVIYESESLRPCIDHCEARNMVPVVIGAKTVYPTV